MMNRVAVFIVAYNAEKHIDALLDRIPDWVAQKLAEGFIIDDSSKDATAQKAVSVKWTKSHAPFRVFRTPYNQGYGAFQANSFGFDFDTDIIIQFAAAGLTIREVPIPTFYGDENCNVDGLKYAWACLKTTFQYRLMQLEIFYDPKFDLSNRARKYTIKVSPTSLHHHIRQLSLPAESELLDLGGGDGGAVA